jgi:hypothetical protein
MDDYLKDMELLLPRNGLITSKKCIDYFLEINYTSKKWIYYFLEMGTLVPINGFITSYNYKWIFTSYWIST